MQQDDEQMNLKVQSVPKLSVPFHILQFLVYKKNENKKEKRKADTNDGKRIY